MSTPFGTVVHLKATGHVLFAISSGALEPELEQLAADGYLRVRVPGTTEFVDVAADPARVSLTKVPGLIGDVIDQPHHYVMGQPGEPPTFGPAPVTTAHADDAADAGKAAVVVYQRAADADPDDRSVTVVGVCEAGGGLPGEATVGATAVLVAIKGRGLIVTASP